jgi:DNA-directed RNA polymerase specialized sigma24 family protein
MPSDMCAERTDGQLLMRFVNREDVEAFKTLVQRHRPRVLTICRGLLRDAHHAEDACQATFLVLQLRCPSGSISYRLARGLQMLRRRLLQRGTID